MDKIYKLYDPNTLEVRYIGYTNQNKLKNRLACHISESRRKHSCHRHYWINSLMRKGQKPLIKCIKVLAKGGSKTWQEWERYYIKKYKDLGYNLVNGTDGGDGQTGMKHSEETKERIRRSCKEMGKGRKFTKEHCENISKAQTGKKLSLEHRESLRQAGYGRIQSEETKRKMSVAYSKRIKTNRKRILGISILTGKVRKFESIISAIRQLNSEGITIHRQQISLILNGRLAKKKFKRVKAGGYLWKWDTIS